MSRGGRIFFGGAINQIVLWPVIGILSGVYMNLASSVLGAKFAWPMIGFMSAYPTDVRNGYLLFVAAVFTMVFLFSGLFAGLLGASPGKALCGVRYVDADRKRCGMKTFLRRALMLLAILSLIFLAGPILGFAIGEAADAASLLSLMAGFALLIWAVTPFGARAAPLNRFLGMEPVIHQKGG